MFTITIGGRQQELSDTELCDLIKSQLDDQVAYFLKLGEPSEQPGDTKDYRDFRIYHDFRVRWHNQEFSVLLRLFRSELTSRLNSVLPPDFIINSLTDPPTTGRR